MLVDKAAPMGMIKRVADLFGSMLHGCSMNPYLHFWGKAAGALEGQPAWHPLAYHNLDVAAVADGLLQRQPRKLAHLARLLGTMPENSRRLIVCLVALHDVGKFANAFQCKCEEAWPEAVLGAHTASVGDRHDQTGFDLRDRIGLTALVQPALSEWYPQVVDAIWAAVAGHLGQPVKAGGRTEIVTGMKQAGIEAAAAFAKDVAALHAPFAQLSEPDAGRVAMATWAIAGLTNLADWIGSNRDWFPYRTPGASAAEYWTEAKAMANAAIQKSGILAAAPSAEATAAHLLPEIAASLSPLQEHVSQTALPEGPILAIIEDVTGSGKTEAALLLAARLLADKRADGPFFALPTMATANAMYERLTDSYRRLFTEQLSGKSGGGRAYGYDVLTGTSPTGTPLTVKRKINVAEAEVVREIYRRFAAGVGPRAIARSLNDRGVTGPNGHPWGDTTIRGHAKKCTGVLNNELYRGKRVWGRQRFIKHPVTGRRVARLNPAGSETVVVVPNLRIVDDELWAAVKSRQGEVSRPTTDPHVTAPLNDTHRPRFLLSGLLTCGVCGGGYTITAKDRYGCARRGRQGTCSNSRGIQRHELERRVLDGLRTSMVTPDLVADFIAELNRLQGERRSDVAQRGRKLADVKRKIGGIIDAIERGISTVTTKERLEALEAEKVGLEHAPSAPALPAIHPNLSERYRNAVVRLEEELADPELAAEAKSVLRTLIKTIKIFPGAKRGQVELELHGELAVILAFAQGAKNKAGTPVSRIQVSVVAGACNRVCYSSGYGSSWRVPRGDEIEDRHQLAA